jgi:hypothetical protein
MPSDIIKDKIISAVGILKRLGLPVELLKNSPIKVEHLN